MAARTSSAERSALAQSAPAGPGTRNYLEQWKLQFAGTDWIPWLILALAAFLRFLLLGIKPPHFDEGINGWFVDQVMHNGFYKYDPTNYHGPLHFYVLLLSESLFGRNVWALRLPVVLVSIARIGGLPTDASGPACPSRPHLVGCCTTAVSSIIEPAWDAATDLLHSRRFWRDVAPCALISDTAFIWRSFLPMGI